MSTNEKTGIKRIRFMGYAIPTTPKDLVSIGSGAAAVAGTYLADEDTEQDIRGRIRVMKNAVDQAKERIKDENDMNTDVNVFVVPEFFFHGKHGPYIFKEKGDDPVENILVPQLDKAFNTAEYNNWVFICGSVTSTQLKDVEALCNTRSVQTRNDVVESLAKEHQRAFGPLKSVIFDMLVNFIKICHSVPNCEVRNRTVIVSNVPLETIPENGEPVKTNVMTTEKYFVSNEDFLLYDTSKKTFVITEQMTAYPLIDISHGDTKKTPFDQYAVFRRDGINYGIEICLDHSDVRLRRNIDNQKIDVQIVLSCGMLIVPRSVATVAGGLVFGCDGQFELNDEKQGKSIINGVDCLYVNYTKKVSHEDDKTIPYGAHTQLALVTKPAEKNDPYDPDAKNAVFEKGLDEEQITVLKVVPPAAGELKRCFPRLSSEPEPGEPQLFAGGWGEVHIYGTMEINS